MTTPYKTIKDVPLEKLEKMLEFGRNLIPSFEDTLTYIQVTNEIKRRENHTSVSKRAKVGRPLVLCPLCNGAGKILYPRTEDLVTCHECHGQGIVPNTKLNENE